jgi:hypothetical protein
MISSPRQVSMGAFPALRMAKEIKARARKSLVSAASGGSRHQ